MKILDETVVQQLNPVLVERLVDIFMRTSPESIEEIGNFIQERNAFKMGREAHKLKGSCLSLGAEQMAKICKELQEKGENGDFARIDIMFKALNISYKKTAQALQDFAPVEA